MGKHLILLATVLSIGFRAAAAAEDGEIARHIRELGHDKWEVREAASTWLWAQGAAACDALEKATNDRDLEIANRAKQALFMIRTGATPDTPKEITDMLVAYRRGGPDGASLRGLPWDNAAARDCFVRLYNLEKRPDERRTLLHQVPENWRRDVAFCFQLVRSEPDAGQRAAILAKVRPDSAQSALILLQFYRAEKDAEARRAFAACFGRTARIAVVPLLLEGDEAEAERLLAGAAAGGDMSVVRDWAALLALTGHLAPAIEQYEKIAAKDNPVAKAVVGAFISLTGEYKPVMRERMQRATREIERAKEVLKVLKQARGDGLASGVNAPLDRKDRSTRSNDGYWRQQAEKYWVTGRGSARYKHRAPPDAWDYSRLAIYHRLAGDEVKRSDAVAKMRSFIAKGANDEDWQVIMPMVGADAADEAAEELLKQHKIELARAVRQAQGRFDEADALLRQMADDKAERPVERLVSLAIELARIRDRDRAVRLCESARQDLDAEDAKAAEEAKKAPPPKKPGEGGDDGMQDDKARDAREADARRLRERVQLLDVLQKVGAEKESAAAAQVILDGVKAGRPVDWWVQSYAARTLYASGRREMAVEFLRLSHARKENRDRAELYEAAAECGLRELAFEFAGPYVQRLIDLQLSIRREESPSRNTNREFERPLWHLFPEKCTAAMFCFERLWDGRTKADGSALLKTVREAMEEQGRPAKFLAMVDRGVAEAPRDMWKVCAVLERAAEACREMGQNDRADQLERDAMAGGPSRGLAMKTGDRLAKAGQWAAAAAAYAKAWQAEWRDAQQKNRYADMSNPDASTLFAEGRALTRAGQAAEGARLVRTAQLIPLGDRYSRLSLALRMDIEGLGAEARVQRRLIDQFAEGGSDTMLGGSGEEIEAGDWAAAERVYAEQALNTREHGDFTTRVSISGLPAMAETYERLVGGDVDGAMRVIRDRLRRCPGDSWTVNLFCHPLEKMGRKKEADEIFRIVFAVEQERCRRTPGDSNAHNSLAWTCSVCARELDVALEHGKEAVRMTPYASSYLDTLAEVYFQRGEFESARIYARKAVEHNTERAYYRRRLASFERPDAELRTQMGPRPPSISMEME